MATPVRNRSWGRPIGNKISLFEGLYDYERQTKRKIDFLPETYDLGNEAVVMQFLARTDPSLPKFSDSGKKRGCDLPWVLETKEHCGKGVTILGPNSDRLHDLRRELRENTKEGVLVQAYLGNEMTWHVDGNGGKPLEYKFDLRTYMLVASAKPLMVFYGQGQCRRGSLYQERDFNDTHAHLTNAKQNTNHDILYMEHNDTIGLWDGFKEQLERHVSITPSLRHISDPMKHIDSQIKHILATSIDAFRPAWDMFNSTDNAYALMGADFIVQSDLKVWLTEIQRNPGIGNEVIHPNKAKLHDGLFRPVLEIVEHIMEQQFAGKPVSPIPAEKMGSFELIYTDEWMYRYPPMDHPCAA